MTPARTLSVVLLSLATSAASAPGRSPATKPAARPEIPDLCASAVDPYNSGAERMRFLAAAGKDAELSPEEFAASAKADKPFARLFDTWKAMAKFDTDSNGTLDWVEAEAYRRDLRSRVLKAFDSNGDFRLRGDERTAANRYLATGGRGRDKALLGARAQPPTKWPTREELIKTYDTDGDGKLSDAERKAAWAELRARRRKQRLHRYDLDGDGELDHEERRLMNEDQRAPWRTASRRWMLQHFDADGDGDIGEQEREAIKEFGRKARKVGEYLERAMTDINGDGTVSKDERKEVRRQWIFAAFELGRRTDEVSDLDGDGSVSVEERQAFRQRLQDGFIRYAETLMNKHDADKSGRLEVDERTALLATVRSDLQRRVKKHDADKNGWVSPPEAVEMLCEWGVELGLAPESD